MGDSKFEPFPPICGTGRVTIPPRRYSRKFEPFLRPCEPMTLKAGTQSQNRTELEHCRTSAFCTGLSKNRQIRGYEKNAGKRAVAFSAPCPSTSAGKAHR